LADHDLFDGDPDSALKEYQAGFDGSTDAPVQEAALLGVARSNFAIAEYANALDALRTLIDEHPDALQRPDAYFLLGQTYDALKRYNEAADAYQNYLSLRPGLIDSYVLEMRGDALYNAGSYSGALNDYRAALESPRSTSTEDLQVTTAHLYALTGDMATAIVMYQDIYSRTSSDYTKAQLDFFLGQAYTAVGQTDNADNAYLDAVDNYPLAYDSYQSLVTLVDAGYAVDELQRGLVDYFAGQYQVAVSAFDRYLDASPAQPAVANYYKGLALSSMGNFEGAIQQWDQVIDHHPGSSVWDNAWEQKAYIQWSSLDQYTDAEKTLLDFVAAAPGHPRAAEFLYDAGRVAERAGKLVDAARIWERVPAEYASSDYAYRAQFAAGICYYRAGDFSQALAMFQQSLNIAGDISQRSASTFWAGKSQSSLGDDAAARATFEQATGIDPTGYYSERARDILIGRAPFTPPQVFDFSFDKIAERTQAENWMRSKFPIPANTDLSGLGSLLTDASLQRGLELWRLGLYNQAIQEFEALRVSQENDPVNSFRLAGYFADLGVYRSSILAARRVLSLAGMDDAASLNAPIYFSHLRFGTYYANLVIPLAGQYDLHPLLIFSIMRQESFFESTIKSSAGALGLMQFIPATGQDRANKLGWPANYTEEDLYRPLVSITFGAGYLHDLESYLDGDLYAALAAYNGGPGNAKEWKELANGDPDLFLEVVRFDETHRYILSVYELFTIYRRIYDRTP
jgi:soluble lytic murein transglycosylase